MEVWLYAGQGSQSAGMGKDLYERFPAYRKTADQAAADLKDGNIDVLKLMHEGPQEKLSETANTQPCMAVFAAGVTEVLKENGISPDAACGLSLGEYGALYAAGVWDVRTYISLVAYRGKKMAEAVKGMQYCMSAVLGVHSETVGQVCADVESGQHLFVRSVNYNCPGQVVICGEEAGVSEAERILQKDCSAKTVRLNTTSPFHTELLKEAGEAMRLRLAEAEMHRPQIPVAMNVTGQLLAEDGDIPGLLVQQLQSPVRFEDDLRCLLLAGADSFVEIGPGRVLSGLCRKTARSLNKKVRCTAIENAEDLQHFLDGRVQKPKSQTEEY